MRLRREVAIYFFTSVVFLNWGCVDIIPDDLGMNGVNNCTSGNRSWCSDGVVKKCGDGLNDIAVDCIAFELDCIEWTDDDGRKNAGCKVSDERCPDDADRKMICVDECFHVECVPGRFPALGVGPPDSDNCCEWNDGWRCILPDSTDPCCDKNEDGEPLNCI